MLKIAVLSMLLLLAASALARDVSTQQAAAQFTRQELERAEAEHKADAEKLAQTKKAFEQLKKQYEEEQKKTSLSEKKMQEAKARHEKAQEALDRAWKQ